MKLAIIGPPGSGKGTYAQLLEKKYHLKRITVGNILRKAAKKDKKLEKILDSGKLAPHKLVNRLLMKNIPKDNYILDGSPRRFEEAKSLIKNNQIDKAILIKVSDKTVKLRLKGRLQCPKCGRTYHIKFLKPKHDRICDYDGTKLEVREDEGVIDERLKVYRKFETPIIKYFKKLGIIKEVNGERPIKVIFKDVEKLLKD
ncbi:MAG: nucleoside monophosphate kinase [Candidatus Nanoarchaeia archaeon]|nr:nucleoside monophosphate kinase [Candidatus Nanoarchaeia archaeon]MDD5587552.1 nucleoside monophosphate kinase [Candidatus Nanoarchaeia archaeon]